jgi:hypothetical protein
MPLFVKGAECDLEYASFSFIWLKIDAVIFAN